MDEVFVKFLIFDFTIGILLIPLYSFYFIFAMPRMEQWQKYGGLAFGTIFWFALFLFGLILLSTFSLRIFFNLEDRSSQVALVTFWQFFLVPTHVFWIYRAYKKQKAIDKTKTTLEPGKVRWWF